MFKKISLLLVVVLCLTTVCLPSSVSAEDVKADTVSEVKTQELSTEILEEKEIGNNLFVENEPIDTFVDESQMPVFDENNSGISTFALDGTKFTESVKTIKLSGLTQSVPDFTSIATQAAIKSAGGYADSDYLGLQGGCFDGTYYYYAFMVKNSAEDHIDSCIISGKMSSSGAFTLSTIMTGLKSKLRHVNDLTYNKDTGKIVIACCEEGYHNFVYTITPANLRNGNKTFTKKEISGKVTSIDYNSTRAQYVVGLSGLNNAFAILDSDFEVIKSIGYENDVSSDSGPWATQGIYADNLYIYCLYYYNEKATNNDRTNDPENRLRIFDWDGDYVKTLEFVLDKSTTGEKRIYECENIFMAKDRLLIGFSCVVSQQSRKFCYLDMSDYTFHMQFCPDENVDDYIGKYDNGNVNAIMIYGLSTPLKKFRVCVTGKKFKGWTAYRAEVDKWYYSDSSGETRGWYKAGKQPSGYTKYVYADKQSVSKTGSPGEHVLMCAKWESTSKFTVSFMSNGGKGTMTDQTVTYGTSTALKANKFTKTNRDFYAWNAYWSEKNRWYYESADGTDKGWYKEGYEPAGYKKYTYSDGQSVAKTVYAGSHVYMYAVWNEYYIQYDANGAMIEPENVLDRHTGKYETGAENKLKKYKNSDIYISGKPTEHKLVAYRLYRREIDKWMYINSSGTKKWYALGKQPSGYEIYERSTLDSNVYLGATALPGEHLLLVAVWE